MATGFAPAKFRIVRGTSWSDDVQLVDQLTGQPVDLTGIVALVMRFRRTAAAPIVLELSMAAGTLVLVNAAEGRIGIRVDSVLTRTFPERNHTRARYLYDAVIERTAGQYEPAIRGRVTVLPQITRPWAAT